MVQHLNASFYLLYKEGLGAYNKFRKKKVKTSLYVMKLCLLPVINSSSDQGSVFELSSSPRKTHLLTEPKNSLNSEACIG